MKRKPEFIKAQRRHFLKGAVVAGGAAAIAAPAAAHVAGTHDEVEAESVGHKGYEENEYVRGYYELARF